jgi:hypothetical protein
VWEVQERDMLGWVERLARLGWFSSYVYIDAVRCYAGARTLARCCALLVTTPNLLEITDGRYMHAAVRNYSQT